MAGGNHGLKDTEKKGGKVDERGEGRRERGVDGSEKSGHG